MRIVAIIACMICGASFAQHPNDPISLTSLDKKYLEQLIKDRVDSVRLANGFKKLANDSILYIAASDHAAYLYETKRTSHYQNENSDKKTPDDRVRFYGGKDYLVGENIARSYVNRNMRDKKGRTYSNRTYGTLADDLVNSWVNSPPHYENILTDRFVVTGLAISVDTAKDEVKAVQKFAEVRFKYTFPENKTLFPYSDYVPPHVPASFKGIKSDRLKNRYAYGIKAPKDSVQFCASCNVPIDTNSYKNKLLVKGRRLIFYSPNIDMMYQILDTWRSGLAVEIVSYKPYDCGNPEYFTEPSRRNGQNLLNGEVLKPVYRRDLKDGFKRGRYRWWNRLKKKGEPVYFEYTLGKLPRDIDGYIEANVLVIKNKKVCRVMHFSDVCGEEMNEFYEIPYMTRLNKYQYGVNPELSQIEFTIPFEQGKYRYNYDDIKPLIDSVSSETFSVVAAHVKAYSSLEGNRDINLALQKKRARSVVRALEDNQRSEIVADISTDENWNVFRTQIAQNHELNVLRGLSNDQIREKLSDRDYARSIEPFLAQQRYAVVRLDVHVDPTKEGLGGFLTSEFNRYLDTVQHEFETVGMSQKAKANMDTMASIQWFMYHSIKNGKVDSTQFATLSVPQKLDFSSLIKDHLWYDLDIHGAGSGDAAWERDFYNTINRLDRLGISSYEIRFDVMNYLVRNWRKKAPYGGEIDRLKDNIAALVSEAPNDSIRNISNNLMVNFHIANAVYRHFSQRTKDDIKMRESMAYLLDHFLTHSHTDEDAWKLGSFFTWGEQEDLAYHILHPRIDQENVHHELLALYTKLLFAHTEEYHDTSYVQFVMATSTKLSNSEWCDMFVGPCNISFQIFDYEPLRSLYCTKCSERANYAEKPEKWVNGSSIIEK